MKTSRRIAAAAAIALTCLTSSCSEPQTTPAAPENPLTRWTAFFDNQFGHAPGPALIGDFNGDGQKDVATQIQSNLIVFHDMQPAEPKEWELLTVNEGVKVTIQPAAAVMPQLPLLRDKVSDKQDVFVIGERSPVLMFWYPEKSAYAWQQPIPKELEPARADAQKRLGVSFNLTKNNLFGLGEGFEGETDLVEQFAADFDGDGNEDYLAIDTIVPRTRFYFYKSGALPPSTQDIEYAGTKASVHLNPNRETIPLPDFDGEQKERRITPKGAYVEIWNPEKSGVIVVLEAQWTVYWVSD
jgi:hypothetical protein